MGDLILFDNSTAQLSRYQQAIRHFMQTELELTLRPHKQTLQACHQYVGYWGTGFTRTICTSENATSRNWGLAAFF